MVERSNYDYMKRIEEARARARKKKLRDKEREKRLEFERALYAGASEQEKKRLRELWNNQKLWRFI